MSDPKVSESSKFAVAVALHGTLYALLYGWLAENMSGAGNVYRFGLYFIGTFAFLVGIVILLSGVKSEQPPLRWWRGIFRSLWVGHVCALAYVGHLFGASFLLVALLLSWLAMAAQRVTAEGKK